MHARHAATVLCCIARLTLVLLWMFGPMLVARADGPDSAFPLLDVRSTVAPKSQQARAATWADRLASDGSLRRDARGRVQVEVVIDPKREAAAKSAIARLGGVVTKGWPTGDRLQGWLPEDALDLAIQHDAIHAVQNPMLAVSGPQGDPQPLAGSYETEALAAMNVDVWHQAGYDGTGVRVGIIDQEYLGLNALLGSELPAEVIVRNCVDGQPFDDLDTGSTWPHGVACAEVIHDIAPGAALYLAKIATGADFFEAVSWMTAQQVDILSTSFGFFNVSAGDGTGLLAQQVQQTRDAGILWVTAAGNERTMHWGGSWADADGNDKLDFVPGVEVNWLGPEDAVTTGAAYEIPAGETFIVYARWDDWHAVSEDFCLVILGMAPGATEWQELLRADSPQNGGFGQAPTEWARWTTQFAGAYGFGIERVSGERPVHFEIFAPKLANLAFHVPERSLVNLADASAAVAVGALDALAPWPQEWYSSEGPTNGPGGAAEGGFVKPDICGYANVSTVSYGERIFKGTSSATPHTAAAAALILCASPLYTPDDLQAALEERAIDMGAPGHDTAYGVGRAYLGDPPISPPASPTPEPTLGPQPTLMVKGGLFLPVIRRP